MYVFLLYIFLAIIALSSRIGSRICITVSRTAIFTSGSYVSEYTYYFSPRICEKKMKKKKKKKNQEPRALYIIYIHIRKIFFNTRVRKMNHHESQESAQYS